MIKNRSTSLTIIIFIYILAAFCGFFTYNYLTDIHSFSYQLSLFLADVLATIVVFIFSLIFKNASVYDPYWSVQPPVILGLALAKLDADNPFLGCLLFAAVLFWALRLTANWCYNFESFEYQDWRYVMLKEKSGKLYPLVNFFGIHLFPTCVVYLCILPAVTAIAEGATFQPLCLSFIILSLLSAVFQGIADVQMHRFRASSSGGFIRTGLWKHGRHPNYACEILMWWGIGLASIIALGWQNWYLLTGALVNTLMFLFISIPMADKRQSRKPGFEEYKKATRILF
jgi:steroid 5-alpha reductase family enzyme